METIKLQWSGRDVAMAFNLNTIRKYCRIINEDDLNEAVRKIYSIDYNQLRITDLENLNALLFAAMAEGARIENIPFELSSDDVFAELWDNQDNLAEVMNKFIETLPVPDPRKPATKPAKKQRGMSSSR